MAANGRNHRRASISLHGGVPEPEKSAFLAYYGLARNPFLDRTAEKTTLDATSVYLPSDLQGFRPTSQTYAIFGPRGSGKTTLRRYMADAYMKYNTQCRAEQQHAAQYVHTDSINSQSTSRPYFIADLCRPRHMAACLEQFQHAIGAEDHNWEAKFSSCWTSGDFVDCALLYVATNIVESFSTANGPNNEGGSLKVMIMESIAANPTSLAIQLLLLTHLYARVDSNTLRSFQNDILSKLKMRSSVPNGLSNITITPLRNYDTVAALGVSTLCAKLLIPNTSSETAKCLPAADDAANASSSWDAWGTRKPTSRASPIQTTVRERSTGGGNIGANLAKLAIAALPTGLHFLSKFIKGQKQRNRVAEMQAPIRVLDMKHDSAMLQIMSKFFTSSEMSDVHTIQRTYIGHTASNRLELVQEMLRTIGFEALIIFGDCFDEVPLLNPVVYPGALKHFANQICQNRVLDCGNLHVFFPGSRMQLDLNTDSIQKSARFDRHYIRDMKWTHIQLEELAERRFRAAVQKSSAQQGETIKGERNVAKSTVSQHELMESFGPEADSSNEPKEAGASRTETASFKHIFKNLSAEDFASGMAKLHTPRELLICMMEVINRMEGRNDSEGLYATADDLEMATSKAYEQTS